MDEKQLPKTDAHITVSDISGNFSQNKVNLDLDRFVELMHENQELTNKIRDLEDGKNNNPWQSWIHFAEMLNKWRIFPRAFITVYMVLLYYSTMWFMALEQPSGEQSALISVIVGAGAAWFGLYTKTTGDGD